jgi:hypothetical protein
MCLGNAGHADAALEVIELIRLHEEHTGRAGNISRRRRAATGSPRAGAGAHRSGRRSTSDLAGKDRPRTAPHPACAQPQHHPHSRGQRDATVGDGQVAGENSASVAATARTSERVNTEIPSHNPDRSTFDSQANLSAFTRSRRTLPFLRARVRPTDRISRHAGRRRASDTNAEARHRFSSPFTNFEASRHSVSRGCRLLLRAGPRLEQQSRRHASVGDEPEVSLGMRPCDD